MRSAPLVAALLLAACTRAPRSTPPVAEFLVATEDSTYWVTSGPAGIHVRASEIMLAQYGGRFHELYVADDDRSLDNALLVGANVYSRDVISGDSSLVFADTLIAHIAHDYAVAHPDEQPLAPDDPEPRHPSVRAMSDVSLLDVHGPFLSLEYHAQLRRRRSDPWHSTWREVVDLRGARHPQLHELIGAEAAARALTQGREQLAKAIAYARTDQRARSDVAALALSQLHFDEQSFTLADTNGEPAVAFAARVTAGPAARSVLQLSAVIVAPPAPEWWKEVRPTLPMTDPSRGAGDAHWTRAHYELRATYDSTRDLAFIVLVDSARRSWKIGTMSAPLRHIFWLDTPPTDSVTRAALRRAFNEAALDNSAIRASYHPSSPPPVAGRSLRRRHKRT